jgi:hypothetical protein
MALTRAFLKGMNLTDEQISAVIEEHTNVTDALKADRDKFKGEAEKLAEVQKELDTLKKDVADNNWQEKYTKEHDEFEKYKTDIATKEKQAQIKTAYTKLLSDCKVGDKYIDSIIKVTSLTDLKLNDKGEFENAEDLKKKIETDWSGFIVSKETRGAGVETPPKNDNKDGGGTGRAAELANKYYENLYGKVKEE